MTTAAKAAAGQWKTDAKGRRYRYRKSGKYAKNVWRKINGGIYRFDAQGYVETGWFVYGGKKYYAGKNGELYVSRWLKKGNKYYYLLANGTLARKRMVKSGKKYYYVNKSGVRVTNAWITKNGKKYYFNWDGVRMQNSWVMDHGKLYYLGSSGAMAVKQWVDGKKYYVGADGARKKDCVVGGYYLDSSGRKTVKVFKGDYIFVGDSRMVGMKLAIAPKNTKYIAKESMGYTWLASTAGVELKNYLKANPDVTVVLAFGVNDLGNIDNYIAYYKKLIAQFPKTRFYVMSVNPVNEAIEASHGYTVKNSQIAAFNKKMRAAVGTKKYLNTYSYMKKRKFGTSDGVHYTLSEYRKLYNYVIKKIKK